MKLNKLGTCKCVYKLSVAVCSSKQIWNDDRCRCKCREDLIDTMVCDKGFAWNPSNCECECDKFCGIGEYLDYKSCHCKKNMIGKLIEDCTNVIEENKIYNNTSIISSNNDCLMYFILFLVLLVLFLIISGIIIIYFYWYKRLDTKNKEKRLYHVKFNPKTTVTNL